MYDILINRNGTPRIVNGGFVPANYSQFLEQKLYNALMNMPTDITAGVPSHRYEIISESIHDYLVVYFSGDIHINTQNIEIDIEQVPGGSAVNITLSYEADSIDEEATVSSRMKYSLDKGAFKSTDFEPEWLRLPDMYTGKEISLYVEVEEPTDRVELPALPYPADDDILSRISKLITIIEEERINELNYTHDVEFTIELNPSRSKYSILKEVREITGDNFAINNVVITDTPDIEYNIGTEYGEHILYTDRNQSGTVKGTVEAVPAFMVTDRYVVDETMVNEDVFKTRYTPGRYYAVFPKSIRPGRYFIHYTAVSEDR